MNIKLAELIAHEEMAKTVWLGCVQRREEFEKENKKIKQIPKPNRAIMAFMKRTA